MWITILSAVLPVHNAIIIKYHEIPADEIWRVSLIKEILHILDYEMDLNFDKSNLGFILNYVAES